MSHFWIKSWTNRSLTLQFDLTGRVQTGKYRALHIVQVFTTCWMRWGHYVKLQAMFVNTDWSPCVNETRFTHLLHFYNMLSFLNIRKMRLSNDVEIDAEYTIVHPVPEINPKVKALNHFYFDSFNVDLNHKKIKHELDRLIHRRDDFDAIHFHLDNNGGGDLVPVHLILRCLIGKREPWMKPVTKPFRGTAGKKNMSPISRACSPP